MWGMTRIHDPEARCDQCVVAGGQCYGCGIALRKDFLLWQVQQLCAVASSGLEEIAGELLAAGIISAGDAAAIANICNEVKPLANRYGQLVSAALGEPLLTEYTHEDDHENDDD